MTAAVQQKIELSQSENIVQKQICRKAIKRAAGSVANSYWCCTNTVVNRAKTLAVTVDISASGKYLACWSEAVMARIATKSKPFRKSRCNPWAVDAECASLAKLFSPNCKYDGRQTNRRKTEQTVIWLHKSHLQSFLSMWIRLLLMIVFRKWLICRLFSRLGSRFFGFLYDAWENCGAEGATLLILQIPNNKPSMNKIRWSYSVVCMRWEVWWSIQSIRKSHFCFSSTWYKGLKKKEGLSDEKC